MDKKRKYSGFLSALCILLILSGCDEVGGPEHEETVQYSFDYEIYDGDGALLSRVTHESIDDERAEKSGGYFGKDFMPQWLLESIEENIGRNPDDFITREIYLHAETGSGESNRIATLRFQFPDMDHWEAGTYLLPTISIEDHLAFLRSLWETRHHIPFAEGGSFGFRFIDSSSIEFPDNMARVDYSESGFITEKRIGIKIDRTGTLYHPLQGEVTLEQVSDSRIDGEFSVEMVGIPMNILFFSDEFPEDPEIQMFRFTGSFSTVHGDYFDLVGNADM